MASRPFFSTLRRFVSALEKDCTELRKAIEAPADSQSSFYWRREATNEYNTR